MTLKKLLDIPLNYQNNCNVITHYDWTSIKISRFINVQYLLEIVLAIINCDLKSRSSSLHYIE